MSIPALPDSLISALAGTVRSVSVSVTYAGQDISTIVQPSLLDCRYRESYRDNAMSDVLDLRIGDPEGLFRRTFSLDLFTTVTCNITLSNFGGTNGNSTRALGEFFVHRVQVNQDKGSGTVIDLSCTSIPNAAPFRLQKNSSANTGKTLQQICQAFATNSGLTLNYLAKDGATVIQRYDQVHFSDARALQALLQSFNNSMKIVNRTLFVQSNATVESQKPSGVIVCPTSASVGGYLNGGIIHWSSSATTDESFSGCTVSYTDSTTGQDITQTVNNPNADPSAPKVISHHTMHPDDSAVSVISSLAPLNAEGRFLTIQPRNTTIPPVTPAAITSKVSQPAIIKRCQETAASQIRRRTRLQNGFQLTLPFSAQFFSGTTWTLQGFTIDADKITWLLSDVDLSIRGGAGSETGLTFVPAQNW